MRVLVTRAEADAMRTAKALAAMNHEAILAPVLRIVPTTTDLPLERTSAVLATSAHAFVGDASRFETLHRSPLFAVGQATAEAGRKAGFKDVRIAHGDASALSALVTLTLPRPARLLFLAGRDRKPDVEATLERAGYGLTVVEAYAAEAEARWPDPVCRTLAEGGVEVALHFSRRSAALALDMAARHDLTAVFLALAQLCLSEDLALPLRQAGASRILVAAEPNEAALLARLADAVP